jgi:hypothetical protein
MLLPPPLLLAVGRTMVQRLVDGFLRRRPGFNAGLVRVWFMWGKVTLWQGFSFGVLQFHPVSIIPLLSHTDLCVSDRRHMILTVVRRFVPVRLCTKCHLAMLPFWCHYSTTCHTARRYIRGHRRGDLVSNKTVNSFKDRWFRALTATVRQGRCSDNENGRR